MKKGFTLIELLSIFVILAIVAIIATPIVLNIMNKVKKDAFMDSAHSILKAANNYYLEMKMNRQVINTTFNFPSGTNSNGKKIGLDNKLPDTGYVTINSDGTIELVMEDRANKLCIVKESSEETVTDLEGMNSCTIALASNLFNNGGQELSNNTSFSSFTYASDVTNGKYLYKTTNSYTNEWGKEYIPVDNTKKYILSVDAKASNTTAKYYVGLVEFDQDKRVIAPENVSYVNNSTTKLKRDLNNGDTVVYFDNLANWNNYSSISVYSLGFIFWNYKDSTGYQYPKETYSRNISIHNLFTYSNINKTNNTITLTAAWTGGKYPAGTDVSQRAICSGTYNYVTIGGIVLTTSWKNYSGTINGYSTNGTSCPSTKFRKATKYVKFLVLNNYNSIADSTLYLKNIKLKKLN